MKDDNLRHWTALERTDPSYTKPFDKGRFKGTATAPVWQERLLTAHFGPCGIGWGMLTPDFTLVPAGEELLVFCTVGLWYRDGEDDAMVYGVGGDKVVRIERNGKYVSDEAYKAAFTDALTNAMRHLGVGADIRMGLFDDNKYVRELRQAFAEDAPLPRPLPAAAIPPAISAASSPGHSATGNGADTKEIELARAAYQRLQQAIVQARTSADIDGLVNPTNANPDMQLVATVNPASAERLVQYAQGRRIHVEVYQRLMTALNRAASIELIDRIMDINAKEIGDLPPPLAGELRELSMQRRDDVRKNLLHSSEA